MVSTMGPRAPASSEGSRLGTFLWKLGAEHLGRRCPKDFTVPRTWLIIWVRLRIGAGETGQLLGIELVGLTPLAIDQSSLTRISDQYFVAALGKQTTYPGRVGSNLDGDMQRLFRIEPPPHRLWGGAQPALFDDLAVLGVDETEVTVLISDHHTRRHLHSLPDPLP